MALFSCILLGVIASSRPFASVAAFTCPDKTLYRREGSWIEGWYVDSIEFRHVTLKLGTSTLRLMTGEASTTTPKIEIKSKDGFELVGNRILVTEALQRHIAGEGLLSILMQAASEPVEGGYRIFQIDPGSVFELIGMEDNDIITELDGEPLSNPLTTMLLLNRARSLKSFSFRFQRKGVLNERFVEIH